MIIEKDYFNNPIAPDYVLCKANKERIGILKCTEKTADIKYADLNEIHFTTYMHVDDKKNPYYDDIDIMKYILLPNIGFFFVSDCDVRSEGTEFEYKEVIAKSYEGLMAQKYLENFVVNTGSVDSIDGVQFYNIGDKEHSLLHLVLNEKCTDWKIGHCDAELYTKQRSFEISRQDVYSFLMNEVATAFECVFLFDTINNTINIYKEENVGENTDIHVSYNNLLKHTNISCSIDDIKTCLTVTGADDLSVREINMGSDRIYDFSPFNSLDYMSEGLYNAYNKWIELYNSNVSEYTTLLSDYQNYYKEINNLTYKKMPDNTDNTDWSLYGLNPLKEKLSVYEQKQAVSMKAGHGETSSPYYESEYLPIYNTISDIKVQIEKIETELASLKTAQDNIYTQMSNIMSSVSMENNFTEEQLSELSTFIREDELNSDNFVVTDTMTDDERFEMLNEMLKFGQEELKKVSTPQLSFSADMANIFAIPEFEKLYGKFDVGNYIWVSLRDDYHIKTKLLNLHINFYDVTDFSVGFGNISRKAKTRYSDVSEMIKAGVSAATSVSFNKSYWSQAYKDTDNINQMLADGLLSAGNYLSSGDDSEMIIDKRGIFVNTTSGSYAGKDSIFLGGGRVLFTDDAWKTVAMAVGRADVNGESRFGVFADFCIASYIAGSTIEGSTIKTTKMIASEIESTSINNGDGTFTVDPDGNMVANSGKFKGEVTASTITGSSINNGNGTFSVDENGKVVASDMNITKGTIGGIVIENNSLHSSNNNWYINADGTTSFTTPYIGGVQSGSSFGGITYNTNGTSGNFNYGFSADTAFGLSGGALTNFNNMVANKVTANYIEATAQLSAKYATIDSLNAANANIAALDASYARMNELVATKASIEDLNATNATVENLKTSSISCSRLTSGTVNGRSVEWKTINYVSDILAEDSMEGFLYLKGYTTNLMYVMAG